MNHLEEFKVFLFQEKKINSKITIKNYISDVNKFILWSEKLYGQFSPQDINPELIDQFKNDSLKVFSAVSVERYLSTLRNFFAFLKAKGQITESPMETDSRENLDPQAIDPWNLRQFKNYLYLYNSSPLTIKNYLLDVKQFIQWAHLTLGETLIDINSIAKHINKDLIESFKQHLLAQNFSPSSVNRKLSSLRKYFSWTSRNSFKPAQQASLPEKQFYTSETINEILSTSTPLAPIEKKIDKTALNETYSSIPPIRLFQKSLKGLNFLLEKIFVTPIVLLLTKLQYKLWEASGKQIFSTGQGFLTKKINQNISKVLNVPKNIPFEDSLSFNSLPLPHRLWLTIRYKRPNWYKRYHKHALAHYINLSVLLIFCTIVGVNFYSNLFKNPGHSSQSETSVLGTQTISERTIPYIMRLTDSENNPITTARNIRFAIYNDPTASDSGNHRLWEEVRTVYPNKDGVFSVFLGSLKNGSFAPVCDGNFSTATHECGIPEDIFTNNQGLYLGVSIETNSELSPRVQLANVSLADTAKSVQGLLPTTDNSLSDNTNALLALNSSGTVAIPGNQTTTIEAMNGELTLSGNGLLLTTASGSNNNIQLYPDGAGYIDLSRPLINSTNYSNLISPDGSHSAQGAVEIDDLFAILATSSGQSAFTLNQNGNGPILSASSSGSAKFTVDHDGNVFASGSLTSAGVYTQSLGVSGNITSPLIPANPLGFDLGSVISPWRNVFAQNFYSPASGGVSGYVQMHDGAISPTNPQNDLLIGGSSTSSAVFQVIGSGAGAGNIVTSGNLIFKGANPTISMLNGASFNLQTSPDSDNHLTSRFFVSGNGNVGFGTVSPQDTIEAKGDIRIGTTGTNGCIKDASGGVITGTCSSDIRLKKNIQSLPTDILSKIVDLQPVTFNWRADEYPQFGFGDQTNYGLIAQQVESVFPDLVEDNGPGGFKAVKYQLLPIFLLEGIKEQQNQIDSLKSSFANLQITDAGNLSIIPDTTQTDNFLVEDNLGNVAKTIGQFAQIFVGNLETGVIHSQHIFTQNITVAGQSLQDYILAVVKQANLTNDTTIVSPIAQVDQVHTHIISPISQNNGLQVVLNDNSLEIRKDSSSSASTIIDNNGNASFSGTLNSNNLAVNNVATISGTLYAHKIIADEIETSSENAGTNSAQNITNINNVYYIYPTPTPENTATPSSDFLTSTQGFDLPNSFVKIGSVSGSITNVPTLHATTAQFDEGLMSLGPTTLSDTSITGQLSIGSQFILTDNSINVLGGDLQLQPLGQGGVTIAGGKVTFDNNGNLTVNGTAVFNNGIYTNVISPIPGQDLSVILNDSSRHPELDSGSPDGIPGQDRNDAGKFLIKDSSGSAVLSINSIGDLIASGAATISKLNLDNIVAQAQAVTDIEVVATGSAGTTQINPYRKEVTIDNPLVTDKSLIYISPIGNSSQQPVLLRQVPGASFTVGIRQYITVPTKFNWLIIN